MLHYYEVRAADLRHTNRWKRVIYGQKCLPGTLVWVRRDRAIWGNSSAGSSVRLKSVRSRVRSTLTPYFDVGACLQTTCKWPQAERAFVQQTEHGTALNDAVPIITPTRCCSVRCMDLDLKILGKRGRTSIRAIPAGLLLNLLTGR